MSDNQLTPQEVAARPFADLVKPLPDGSIPAVEVAKLALAAKVVADFNNTQLINGPLQIALVIPSGSKKIKLFIDSKYNVRWWGGDNGTRVDVRNQVAIVDYLRSTGFLPAASPSLSVGVGEAQPWVYLPALPPVNALGFSEDMVLDLGYDRYVVGYYDDRDDYKCWQSNDKEHEFPNPLRWLDFRAALRGRSASVQGEDAKAHYRIDWGLLQKAQDDLYKAFKEAKHLNTPEAGDALVKATEYRDAWAGHYLFRMLHNYAPKAPAPTTTTEQEGGQANA